MAPKVVAISSVLVFLMIGAVLAQELPNEQLIAGFQEALKNNKTLEQAYQQIEQKCKKNAGSDWEKAFNTIKDAQTTLVNCASKHVNVTEVNQKMEEAKLRGELDEVFKEYCQRKQLIQNCFLDYTATFKPCLTEVERSNLKIVQNITDRLADFICFKDGHRIGLFIAEKGPDCFQNHTETIQHCLEDKMSSRNITLDAINDPANSTASLQDLALLNLDFDSKTCKEADEVQKCIVDHLKNCTEPTPSNIAESLFKFIRKATPCSQFKLAGDARSHSNTIQSLGTTFAALGAGLITLLLI